METSEITVSSVDEFQEFVKNNGGTVTYFSTPTCNVCKVLKPKLKAMLSEHFPEMKFAYVNTVEAQEMAAQNQIFAVPTILFHLDGKEFIRKSRNVNLNVLAEELERPYKMMFG
ncbi:MAG: thioredoxin family protein [Melioribacteraceae bacterium]|jgi:thioredoxin 1|nr:thioredoxin family protein [Melioribacteraceae bacterium]